MRWKYLIAGGMLVVAMVGLAYFTKPAAMTFDDLLAARQQLESLGLHCTHDCSEGRGGFMLSKEPATTSDAALLCKVGKMNSSWTGRAWVTLNPAAMRVESIPEGAGVRVWGGVLVYGDDALLREIDQILAARANRFF
ncbi:MAG: hypothetical protein HY289_03810 [Planctomycetes bacterium]|nr:hypothetical protein [Planctomycetota bacterium]